MHDSNHKIINCGVTHGSILGPLLFILYVNDIANTTSLLELILFADDTTLLFSHQDIASQNDIINNELQEICNWFQTNKLSVNTSKPNYMVLGTHHITRKSIDINQDIDILTDSESSGSRDVEKVKLNVKLDGVSLNRVSLTKFLGVIIDEKPNMEKSHWCNFKNYQEILECWQNLNILYLKTYCIHYIIL